MQEQGRFQQVKEKVKNAVGLHEEPIDTSWQQIVTDPNEQVIFSALSSDSITYLWSIEALSRQTSLPKESVELAIGSHLDLVRESRVLSRDSEKLYALIAKKPNLRENLAYIRMLITNQTA